ncbi:hypothetical protein [Ottowia beijingensis]|uniref:hypothetical protein n=1 Tax=Ottowia beijingensis TaxID=1207057 RepID=UPI00214D960B|nr:hypothetical protein [Ottowia beijingensis]
MTRHVLDYLGDLRHGRADPARVQARYDSATAPAPDLAASLRDALARGQVHDAQRAALPPGRSTPSCSRRWRTTAAWVTTPPGKPGCPPCPAASCSPASAGPACPCWRNACRR